MRLHWFVPTLCAIASTALADTPQYASESQCYRNESKEVCEKLFPPPPPPKIPPKPLAACTGMLEVATARIQHAILSLRYDLLDEAEREHDEGNELARLAAECQKNSVKTQSTTAAWNAQTQAFMTQVSIINAALEAKALAFR